MGEITLSQIQIFVINFASLLTAGCVIVTFALKIGKKILNKSLEPFDKRIDEVVNNNNKRFSAMQLQIDKNYLVRFLADLEQGNAVDETELEHFWFTYDDYHKNNGNSYIDHKVDKLKKEGKL